MRSIETLGDMGPPALHSHVSDSSLLTFPLSHSSEAPGLSLPTPSSTPKTNASAVSSSGSWLPGLLSGDSLPEPYLNQRGEEDLDGGSIEEPCSWQKRLLTKADFFETEDTGPAEDDTGVCVYRRACEDRGILPSLAVLSSLQVKHKPRLQPRWCGSISL